MRKKIIIGYTLTELCFINNTNLEPIVEELKTLQYELPLKTKINPKVTYIESLNKLGKGGRARNKSKFKKQFNK